MAEFVPMSQPKSNSTSATRGARRGPVRLASFDIVTAVAVVGAIDAVQGQDSVMPRLDLSQAVPEATIDLTELDFADLMALAVDPAPQSVELAEFDFVDLDLEQLLAMQTDPAPEQIAGLASAGLEKLMQVELDMGEAGDAADLLDLTDLELDLLQDLQFGEDAPLRDASYLRVAALDLASFPENTLEEGILPFERAAPPSTIVAGENLLAQPAPVDDMVRSTPVLFAPEPTKEAGPPPSESPANLPPTPANDLFETAQGNALFGNVLANDSDPNGDPLSVTSIGILDTAEDGAVEIASDGQFTYAPPADFNGADSFMYSVMDTQGAEASAMVSIDVIKANSPPIAEDDLFTGATGSILSGNVLANDQDPDGDALTVTSTGLLTTEHGGAVWMQADGGFDYKPPEAPFLTDNVTYWVEDGQGGTASAMLTLAIDDPASVLNGTDGDDMLQGGPGNELLMGGPGNDLLMGGDGNDFLDGGLGIDVLLGGAGDDIFTARPGTGADLDVIADFQPGADVIDLSEFDFSGLPDLSIDADGLGGSMITLPSGDSLSILLVDPASLSPNDFIF